MQPMPQFVTESASPAVAPASEKAAVDTERYRALIMRMTAGDQSALADLRSAAPMRLRCELRARRRIRKRG